MRRRRKRSFETDRGADSSHTSAGHGGNGGASEERWMVSYMDMVTVLMCLFIVLFAMSTIDKQKYEELKASLSESFGVDLAEAPGGTSGPYPTPLPSLVPGPDVVKEQAAQSEVSNLEALQKQLQDRLDAAGMGDRVGFKIDSRGLTAGLVGSETFFFPNNAALRPDAMAVLDAIGPVLAGVPNQISVEGNADPLGSSAPFPSDWELSAARATSVLRHLVEANGVPPGVISLTGFGSSRPVSSDSTQNRRVDIVVESTLPEDVRQLIPGVLQEEGDG